MAKATATSIDTMTNTATANPVDALPAVTISGSVPAVVSEAVEHHRWSNRMSRADVLKEALHEWATARGLLDDARDRLEKEHLSD
jgi:hypothetical protein